MTENSLGFPRDAYLDIETTGLAYTYDSLTVVGIYLHDGQKDALVQLVGEDATTDSLLESLQGVQTIFTYNGSGFDLPFIQGYLGVNLAKEFHHHDLMHDCWRNNLYGGLKSVEKQVGIDRRLKGVDGAEAVITLKNYYRNRPRLLVEAEDAGIPIYVLRAYTVTQMENCLAGLYELNQEDDTIDQALRETQEAIRKVIAGARMIELTPQNAYVRRKQHQLAQSHDLISHSRGKEPHRRVRIYRE